MTEFTAIGALRHTCTACGGSCQSVKVRLLDQDEIARLEEFGRILGIATPVIYPAEGAQLRHTAGGCVFQEGDGRCQIHRLYGEPAKPRICRQFPFIATRAGGELRVGIDPTCFAAQASWRDGPLLEPSAAVVGHSPRSPGEEAAERTLLALLEREGIGVGEVLAQLTGEAPRQGYPQAFAKRLDARVGALSLEALSHENTAGRVLAAGWQRIASGRSFPWSALAPEDEAWALEATRRLLALRLVPEIPSVVGVALLALGGAGICATAAPNSFGETYASWLRGLSIAPFWQGLIPGRGGLLWLARGISPEQG